MLLEYHFVLQWGFDESKVPCIRNWFWLATNYVILLNQSSEKFVQWNSCQNFTKTTSFSNTKWNNPGMSLKLDIFWTLFFNQIPKRWNKIQNIFTSQINKTKKTFSLQGSTWNWKYKYLLDHSDDFPYYCKSQNIAKLYRICMILMDSSIYLGIKNICQ